MDDLKQILKESLGLACSTKNKIDEDGVSNSGQTVDNDTTTNSGANKTDIKAKKTNSGAKDVKWAGKDNDKGSDGDADGDSKNNGEDKDYGIGGVFRRTFEKNFKCPDGFSKDGGVCKKDNSKLTEEPIGDVSHKMNIKVIIDKSVHAGERQSRHQGQFIDDAQIRSIAHKATKKMINDMIFDKMDINQAIHVKDSKSDLNMIGVMKNYKGQLLFKVITVMNKRNFMPKTGTISIEV